MNSGIQSLPRRVPRDTAWMPWLIGTVALTLIVAGLGAYLVFRTGSAHQSPGLAPAKPAPTSIQQSAAAPAGSGIAEMRGVDGRADVRGEPAASQVGGWPATSIEGSQKPGEAANSATLCGSGIRAEPC